MCVRDSMPYPSHTLDIKLQKSFKAGFRQISVFSATPQPGNIFLGLTQRRIQVWLFLIITLFTGLVTY